jgi:hypothetical protein
MSKTIILSRLSWDHLIKKSKILMLKCYGHLGHFRQPQFVAVDNASGWGRMIILSALRMGAIGATSGDNINPVDSA